MSAKANVYSRPTQRGALNRDHAYRQLGRIVVASMARQCGGNWRSVRTGPL